MTILKFPRNICVPLEYKKPLPRQRVFYLGVVYTGPAMCQEVTRLYLKRHGKKNGTRKWSLITYEKYDEYDQREYSIELDNCQEDNVPQFYCRLNRIQNSKQKTPPQGQWSKNYNSYRF